jgi:hypothetical protein
MLCRLRFSMRHWLSGESHEREPLQPKRKGKLQRPADRYSLMAAGLRLLQLCEEVVLLLRSFESTERVRAPSQLDVSLPVHDVGTLLMAFGAQAVAITPQR